MDPDSSRAVLLSLESHLRHEKTGYTVSFLSQLERGIKNPSLDALRAIAQELNLTQREVKTRYEAACNVVRTRFLRYCTEKVEF